MNKKAILDSLKKAREVSKKRNFAQSIDLIINLKNLNIKIPENKVDLFIPLHFSKGKAPKIVALIDEDLKDQAKIFDKIVLKSQFSKLTKKDLKNLAKEYDFFIAQANIMPQVATTFGKVLGPKGKMPNPKAGCVFPPKANLQPIKEKLTKTAYLVTRNELVVRSSIGSESMKDEELEDNILTIYNALIHALPQEKNNIKSVLIKLSMGPCIEITEKGPVVRHKEEPKEEKK